MRIIDVSNDQVWHYFADLIQSESFFSGTERILVVGVASAGVPLADIFQQVSDLNGIRTHRWDVTVRRPSTKAKKRFAGIGILLAFCPRLLVDTLRRMELHYMRWKKSPERTISSTSVPPSVVYSTDRILIVDDAVDSGHSMKHLLTYIRTLNETAEIRIACLTTTQSSRVIEPSYKLFDHTIVRLPTSLDYRK